MPSRNSWITSFKMCTTLKILLFGSILSHIKAIPDCTRVGTNLEEVTCNAAGNEDYVLQKGLVSDNDGTKIITLRNCRIRDVSLKAFDGLQSLTSLDISRNKLKKLRSGVLDGLSAVTYLNVSYNAIANIPLGLFDQMTNLEVLDFRANKLKNLKLGVFDSLSKLRHLDLSDNMMVSKNLSRHLFDKTEHIRRLDFSGNDMADASDDLLHAFKDLEILYLDRCSLREIPKFTSAIQIGTLKSIVLSNNQIRRVNDTMIFVNLVNLESLNMNFNEIDYIDELVLKPLTKLKILTLRQNRVTNLPETLFQNLPKLITVDLSHNKIAYVPVNAFRGPVLKNLNLSDNRFTYLQNNFCLELRNSGAKLNKFYFNDNPWQCACLKELLDEVKKLNIQYNSAKYNGKEPVCVTKERFTCKRQPDENSFFMELYDQRINEIRQA